MSVNNRRRWIVPWKDSATKPAIYHCISRVVGRGFLLEVDERERFRMLMRMCEKFTGCRVLSYCLMSNHFHVLLEVPPMPEGGISNEELLKRLGALYGEARVAEIAKEMKVAAVVRARGEFELPPVDEAGNSLSPEQEAAIAQRNAEYRVEEIRSRYTRRMHDLSEFMKSLLERFTKWFNRKHKRSGTLWEDRFRSVIVESGTAARTMAAYIDLNPVRAGLAKDPADYRWSSYGEAMGGSKKGNGKKAREGLVRAYCCDQGEITGAELEEKWKEVSRVYRRLMGLALGKKAGRADVYTAEKGIGQTTQNTAELLESEDNETVLKDLGLAKMLLCRVRYFADGAVIGSRDFVNEAFAGARERFGPKRKDGARKMRGSGTAASGLLWSLRDLRKGIV
jgi:putative transposase